MLAILLLVCAGIMTFSTLVFVGMAKIQPSNRVGVLIVNAFMVTVMVLSAIALL